jgi:hypothetical protein
MSIEIPKGVEIPDLRLTREESHKIMDSNPPTVAEVRTFHINMTWSWKGCGFGELWIRRNEDGTLSYDTECMGPESVRKMLYALADHTVAEIFKK